MSAARVSLQGKNLFLLLFSPAYALTNHPCESAIAPLIVYISHVFMLSILHSYKIRKLLKGRTPCPLSCMQSTFL